jgi:hypothetical protein
MPYIKKETREQVDENIIALATNITRTAEEIDDLFRSLPGIMNYSISQLIEYVYPVNDCGYKEFNEVIGFLESLKMEYYRKMVAPYEDVKERQNGPINTEGLQCKKY